MKPIAVLGTGPAGMMAAYAVGLTGKPLAVFGLGQKSRIGGAQFLHKPLPDLHGDPDFQVEFEVHGDEHTYQQKVYGAAPVPFVSFSGVNANLERGEVFQDAWSLPVTYDWLWEQFGARANIAQVTADWIAREKDNFRAIISTIPASAICTNRNHTFTSVDILIAEMSMLEGRPGHKVIYDGTRHRSWYRTSLINGVPGTEWGASMGKDNPFKTVNVRKPISTNCDCHPDIIKVGRYGAWRKGELAHEGFYSTLRELNERGHINIGPKQDTPGYM